MSRFIHANKDARDLQCALETSFRVDRTMARCHRQRASTIKSQSWTIPGAGPTGMNAGSDLAILISICVSVMTNPEGRSSSLGSLTLPC